MAEYEIYGALNRQQKNPNPLLENKFTFRIHKLPETSWSCKSANIPSTSIDVAWQNTNLNRIPHSGIGVSYEPFEVTFNVDEDMNNYIELVNWMRMLAMPVTSDGNSKLKMQSLEVGPERGLVSDAKLYILTNESVVNLECTFIDAFPTYLSEIRFSNDPDNPSELTCTARFAYTYFDLNTTNPTIETD
jgi:hypothetical protein